jgi:hypothetical protein
LDAFPAWFIYVHLDCKHDFKHDLARIKKANMAKYDRIQVEPSFGASAVIFLKSRSKRRWALPHGMAH